MDNPDSPESQDKVGIHTFWNPTVSCHIFCSCSRNVWFLGTFPKYNWYEIIRRYLPKLEFKYFESQLFHFKAIDFSDYRNQWLLCTIPKYKLNSLPFYWPNLEFKCLEIQIFHVTAIVLLITEINSYISRIFTKVGIQILCNSIVPCHRPIWFQAICVVAFPKVLDLAVFRIFTKIGITLFPIPELVQDIHNYNLCGKQFSKSKSHEIIRPWANEVMVIGGSWWYITLSDTPINQISWV